MRTEADRIRRELVAAIENLGDEDWNAKIAYPTPNNRRRRLRSLLGAILAGEKAFDHIGAHLVDLEAYVGSIR